MNCMNIIMGVPPSERKRPLSIKCSQTNVELTKLRDSLLMEDNSYGIVR